MCPRALRLVLALVLLAPALSAASLRRGSPITITDDGLRLLTANPDSQSISVVDAGARTVTAEIRIGGTPQTVAVTPDGRRAFVPTQEGSVVVVSLAANAVERSISIGSELFGAVCDSNRLYVSATALGQIRVYELPSLQQVAVIPTEDSPRGLALADGRLYATHFATGRLSLINTATLAVERVISTGLDSNLWRCGSKVRAHTYRRRDPTVRIRRCCSIRRYFRSYR